MADIIIHRCTLRVVRRSGWSWGPRPQHLLKAAVAALPFLLAGKLGELFPPDADTEISEHVRLTIPIKLSELLALGSEAGHAETSATPSVAGLDQQLIAAVERAFERELPELERNKPAPVIDGQTPDLESQQHDSEKTKGHHVLRLLLGWKRQGELEVHLAEFTEPELEAWCSVLLATTLELAATTKGVRPAVISQAVQEVAQRLERSHQDRVAALRLMLLLVLEVAAQLEQQSPDEVAVRETFAQVLAQFDLTRDDGPTSEPHPEFALEAPVENERSVKIPKVPAAATTTPSREVTSARVAKTEFHIRSVLPFLLLGPLAKVGYLDALAATLEATGLSHEAHAFATALAFKVLSPPARGWRRADDDLAVAAAFAGVEAVPAGDSLAELARKLSGHLTALDSLVSYTLIKGHRPGRPLLLHRTVEETGSAGLLLVEIDGLFPIAWAPDLQSLLPTLKYFNETYLLIQHLSADVETLRALDKSGYRFITDAPPTRGEPWRELRTPRQHWYSNDTGTKDATLLRTAEHLAEAAEETELIWRALKVERPSLPTARHSELERTLTLAASLALGTISWTLWQKVETVAPVLALERFGNLDAKVRFTSTAIQVHLPLGRRQRDLYEHGLLAGVHSVPWLNGRTVEFLGG